MRWSLALCCVLLNSISVWGTPSIRYDDYRVYSVKPTNDNQIKLLRQFERSTNDLSFWREVSVVNATSDIMVSPAARKSFKRMMRQFALEPRLKVANVQEGIDKQIPKRRWMMMDWIDYHPLKDIYGWLRDISYVHSNVRLLTIGSSYEGLPILAMEIFHGDRKPGVILESGIHAREWISPAATTWLINHILESPNDSIWREFNILYFPLVNPDGYEYTWTTDRFWRKTRKPYSDGLRVCYGADPNRNFDYNFQNQWESAGSPDICAETFPGPVPNSESEILHYSNFLNSVPSLYDIFISVHSYGQLIIHPPGAGKTQTPMTSQWKSFGKKAAKAMKRTNGKLYKVDSIFNAMGEVRGDSVDWFYKSTNSTIAYAFELRDLGKHGFLLPPSQIIPTARELTAGVKSVLQSYQQLREDNKEAVWWL